MYIINLIKLVPTLISKYKVVLSALLIVGAVFVGWKAHEYKVGYDQSLIYEARIELQKQLDQSIYEIAENTQEQISQIRIENKTIYNKTEREIVKEKVYEECKVPDEGYQLYKESRQ